MLTNLEKEDEQFIFPLRQGEEELLEENNEGGAETKSDQ